MAVKKLNKKQKAIREQVREELREKGILPPRKKPINRKKYALETLEKTKDSLYTYEMNSCIAEVVRLFLPNEERLSKMGSTKVSDLSFYALKIIETAYKLKEFQEEIAKNNDRTYTLKDMYEQVYAPVMEGVIL